MNVLKAALVLCPCLLLAAPREADACTPPRCWSGAIVPGEDATIPASAEALYWKPMTGLGDPLAADPARLQLTAIADPATPLAFTTTMLPSGHFLVKPEVDLVAGQSYRLVDTTECGEEIDVTGPAVTFAVGPAAPLPTALGTLTATATALTTISVGTVSGSCSADATAIAATVELALSAEAQPWADLLHYQTYVDDQRWSRSRAINVDESPGESWQGRGRDVVYRVCSTDDTTIGLGLEEGSHVVRIDATLPGTSVVLASNTVTIDIACEPNVDPGVDPDDMPSGDDGGCATTSGSLGSLALLLGVLTLRPRRRRRGGPHRG